MNESLHRIAAFGLPTATAVGAVVFDESAVELLEAQRLVGFAVAALDAGELQASGPSAIALRAAHRGALADAVRLEALLVETIEGLTSAGIDATVHKGAAVAHLDYPDPNWRTFGDVDIIVAGDRFDAAVAWFEARGCRRRFDEPRPGFTARFGKGVCLVTPYGLEIDLHRALVAGPYGVVADPATLLEGRATFELAGRTLHALRREERCLAAAFHAVLGSAEPRLVPVRDVAQMLVNGLDTDRLVALAHAWRAEGVLARCLLVADALLPTADHLPLAAWAFGYEANRRERQMVRSYVATDRSYAGQARAALAVVPGFRAKVAYARALAMPDPSYLAHHDGGYRRRVARAIGLGTRR